MQTVTLLVKPASSRCNLQCDYCFYRTQIRGGSVGDRGIMTEETAMTLITRAFEEAQRSVRFVFQGGEPLLAGLPFYRRFIEEVRRQNRTDIDVHFSIQTNGTLLNEEWASFLAEEKFLVGVSLDAPIELHDRLRGSGSRLQVQRGIGLLRQYGVPFNILSVITGEAARHPLEFWQELSPYGYLQIIPYIGEDPKFIPSAEELGDFLCHVFDCYAAAFQSGHPVSVREFDGYLNTLRTGVPAGCTTSGCCGGYFTVEADGSVYPCDYYVADEWCMGNVHTSSFAQMEESEAAIRFIRTSREHPQICRGCRWYRLCRAGCRRYREPLPGMHRDCAAYTRFFTHAAPVLLKMAQTLRQKD